MTAKSSPAAWVAVVKPKPSVMATNWFGSAPWSPLPLTVEVTAYSVLAEPISSLRVTIMLPG